MFIEKCEGEGQGCCEICEVEKGFHRYWTSMLYHIRLDDGRYLCNPPKGINGKFFFSSDDNYRQRTFCYDHALFVKNELIGNGK